MSNKKVLVIEGSCVQFDVVIRSYKDDPDRMFAKGSFMGPRVSFDLPLLAGHDPDRVIGKVSNDLFETDYGYLTFVAEVYDEKTIDLIKSGALKGISAGMDYDEVLLSFPKNLKTIKAFTISELSVVASPAIKNCYITRWEEGNND